MMSPVCGEQKRAPNNCRLVPCSRTFVSCSISHTCYGLPCPFYTRRLCRFIWAVGISKHDTGLLRCIFNLCSQRSQLMLHFLISHNKMPPADPTFFWCGNVFCELERNFYPLDYMNISSLICH